MDGWCDRRLFLLHRRKETDSHSQSIFSNFFFQFSFAKILFSMLQMLNLFGWTLSSVSMIFVIFGNHPFLQLDTKMTPFDFGLYEGLGRVIWAISLCFVIFACEMGYGGPVHRFLAHPFFQPIARLSYAIILLHFAVIWLTMATIKSPIYFSELTAVSVFPLLQSEYRVCHEFMSCISFTGSDILRKLHTCHLCGDSCSARYRKPRIGD